VSWRRDASQPRLWQCALLLALTACAVLPLTQGRASSEPASRTQAEWPIELDGRPLQPLALSDVEQRFAAHFPGRIGRFRSEADTITLRVADRPTRMLHPAADCYQGLGYRIRDARLEHDAHERLWRCFTASRDGRTVRVCERIEASNGEAFTDTSAWYWASVFGKSQGPWLAVTRARPL
jgi:hypothetical protein